MTDTTPEALRALADSLEQWGPLVSSGYEVPAAGTAMFRARLAIRALADEKEEKGWYKPTVDVDTHARQLIGGSFDWPSVYMGGPSPRAMERAESLWDALKEEILPRVLRDARRAALEEAARVAEDLRHPNWSSETEDWVAGTVAVAAAIRSLIDDTGPSIADELAQARDFVKDYQRQLSEEMVRSSVAEAKLAKVQEVLDDLAIRLGDPQRRYDKIGPTWTGKDGHEYSDMSELLDFATEISEQAAAIRALIEREPTP